MANKENKDITWLLDILKALGAVAGSLTSLAVLFVVIGYTIVLSFIQEMKLYGLADFPREFFMEANLQFLSDLGVFFSRNFVFGPCIFLIFLSTSLSLALYSRSINILKWILLLLILLDVIFIFILGRFSEDIQKSILYSVSIPVLIALLVYLILNAGQLARHSELWKNGYLFFMALFLVLALLIPINYGRFIYDLDVYSINAFEYDNRHDNDSMKRIRDDIAKNRKAYYLMGHTTGKEIFFLATSSPKEMTIFDKEAVKFLGVIRNEAGTTQTLRWILRRSALPPMDAISGDVLEKKQIQDLFKRIKEAN